MKKLPLSPFLAFRTIVESVSSEESMRDWGANPPRNQPKSVNHIGQRMFRWAFVLFIPCSSVQNFPKFVCNSAFVCCDRVRVPHRGLRFGMS